MKEQGLKTKNINHYMMLNNHRKDFVKKQSKTFRIINRKILKLRERDSFENGNSTTK